MNRFTLVIMVALLANCGGNGDDASPTSDAGDSLPDADDRDRNAPDLGPPPAPWCGDGIVNSEESCDDGVLNGTRGQCSRACTFEIDCGNGELEVGEVCDDGVNDGSYGGCNPDCGAFGPRCGDGLLTDGEVCDDGVNNGAYGGCDACATLAPYCGDGELFSSLGQGVEELCDDAIVDDSWTSCRPDCSGSGTCAGRLQVTETVDANNDGIINYTTITNVHGNVLSYTADDDDDGVFEYIATHSYRDDGRPLRYRYDDDGDGLYDYDETWRYTANGYLLEHLVDEDSDGQNDSYERWTHDGEGRATSKESGRAGLPPEHVVSYTYAADGGWTEVDQHDADADGLVDTTTTSSYDSAARLTRQAEVDSAGGESVSEWSYDDDGHVLRYATYADATLLFEETSVYDTLGQLARRQVDSDGDGAPDVLETWSYVAGSLTEHSTDQDGDGDADLVERWTYDGGGNLIETTVDVGNDGVVDDRQWYEYANGLVSRHVVDDGDDGVFEREQRWTYDTAGNVTSHRDDDFAGGSSTCETRTYANGVVDQVTLDLGCDGAGDSWTDHDDEGRPIRSEIPGPPSPPTSATEMDYDVVGHLVAVRVDDDGDGLWDQVTAVSGDCP